MMHDNNKLIKAAVTGLFDLFFYEGCGHMTLTTCFRRSVYPRISCQFAGIDRGWKGSKSKEKGTCFESFKAHSPSLLSHLVVCFCRGNMRLWFVLLLLLLLLEVITEVSASDAPKTSNGTAENDATTPTPQLSPNNQTSTSVTLKQKLTHRAKTDFNRKQLQRTESALEMTKPQPLTQEVPVTSKTQVSLADPPNHRDPITTETLQTEAAAQTTTRSIITNPTQAPNPAAETTTRSIITNPTQAPNPAAETTTRSIITNPTQAPNPAAETTTRSIITNPTQAPNPAAETTTRSIITNPTQAPNPVAETTTRPIITSPTQAPNPAAETTTRPIITSPTQAPNSVAETTTRPIITSPTQAPNPVAETTTRPIITSPTQAPNPVAETTTRPIITSPTQAPNPVAETTTRPIITSPTQAPNPVAETTTRPIITSPTQAPNPVAETTTRPIITSPTQAPNPVAETTTRPIITSPTQGPNPDAEICSGRPFDSFMQLKNGSIYAFRGLYFFELDQKSVLPGYPKLIEDVWGISGPIDAAFTRVNCQGKTYIFKGTKYWKFDSGVLEEDYPRDISVGFDRIPDHVDAAFALPASSHNGKEKVYFFKGEQYYTYEFLHKPSHGECIKISESSPSTMNYEPFFTELFSDLPQHHDHHHFINKDWKGLRAPVDAAMAGRIYVSSPRWPRRRLESQYNRQWGRQQYQQNGWRWGQRRRSRSPFWESTAEQGMRMGQGFAERRMELEEKLGGDWDRRWDQDWDQDRRRDSQRQNNRGNYDSRADGSYWDYSQREIPIQSVYFFKGDQYYRADLRTKRVDPAMPPYPRSIAKYWLGCSNSTGAERK
ncbi:vitronectin a isoform X2 [Gouania willdenowi]|uniref:vitronectin a isoform X2 n=1 Tax=Gouania willdenowi TaxID=441366 RepID=UPI001055CFA5|nr:proteoglycan 4-like isoform X2 [Gouania willdenowi]